MIAFASTIFVYLKYLFKQLMKTYFLLFLYPLFWHVGQQKIPETTKVKLLRQTYSKRTGSLFLYLTESGKYPVSLFVTVYLLSIRPVILLIQAPMMIHLKTHRQNPFMY